MSGVRWGGGVSLLRREIYDLLPGSSVRGLRARGLFCDRSREFSKLDFIGGMGIVSQRLPWKSGQEWSCWSCCTGRSPVPFSTDQRRTTLHKMKHYSPSLLSDQQTKSQTTKHPLQRTPPPPPTPDLTSIQIPEFISVVKPQTPNPCPFSHPHHPFPLIHLPSPTHHQPLPSQQ